MELSLVTYRISKLRHKLDGYISAQPLSNDNGKVTALTLLRWEDEIAANLKESGIEVKDVRVISFHKLDDIVINEQSKD